MSQTQKPEVAKANYLKRVTIEGLFGDVNLDLNMLDDITFFIGANGIGKTTAFKLIQAATSRDNRQTLLDVTYDKLALYFSDQCVLRIVKTQSDEDICESAEEQGERQSFARRALSRYRPEELERRPTWMRMRPPAVSSVARAWLKKRFPFSKFERLSPFRFERLDTGVSKPIWEWMRENSQLEGLLYSFEQPGVPDRESYSEILDLVVARYGRVFLYSSNRLHSSDIADLLRYDEDGERLLGDKEDAVTEGYGLRRLSRYEDEDDDENHDLSVHYLSQHLKLKINRINATQGHEAAELDYRLLRDVMDSITQRTKPDRDIVISNADQFSTDMSESSQYFGSEADRITTVWKKYVKDTGNPDEVLPILSTFHSVFTERYEQRFKFAKKAKVFENLLNARFKPRKEVAVSPEGLIVSRADDTRIPLEKLSSGEQHQLVTLYALIFLAEDNSIILFDEPEISLHPEWQLLFWNTMSDIHKRRGHQFVVATHAPNIVGEGRSQVRPLIATSVFDGASNQKEEVE